MTCIRHLKAMFCLLNLSNDICCDCRSLTQRSSTTSWRPLKDTPKRARASKQTFHVTSSASWDSQEILWKVQKALGLSSLVITRINAVGNGLQQQIFRSSSFKGWKKSKLCYKVLSSAASLWCKKKKIQFKTVKLSDYKT